MANAKAKARFKRAVTKAKALYKTGRYNKFSDAVKAAYKTVGSNTTPARSARKQPAKKVAVNNNSTANGKLSGVPMGAMKSEIKKRINGAIDKALVKKYRATKKMVKKKLQRQINNYKKELRKLL
jgi:Mor family transcriptional regulator